MILYFFKWASSGIKDWLWQRISAIIFLLYFLTVIVFWFFNGYADFFEWRNFLLNLPMQIFATLAIFSFMIHAWIGLWTIYTDYIKNTIMKQSFILATIVLIFLYALVSLYLIWGII